MIEMLNKQQPRGYVTRNSAPLNRIAASSLGLLLLLGGCKHDEAAREAAEAPQSQPTVVETGNGEVIHVERAARFPIVQVETRQILSTLQVTGSVNPDISREIPVLSLANGRVVALHVGLGDSVHKGQLVMEVQSPDVNTAFDAYRKAVDDEHLTSVTLERDKLLYNKGAIPQTQLEAAQTAEDDSKADLTATEQQLHIYGVDRNHPGDTVRIYAPASGIIIAQNVTNAAAAGVTYAGATGSLTIADLSHVWVICDVYENDLANVHLGQRADITVNAFPGKTFSGTISDIGAQLDPSLRTAKVRIQVANPGNELRIGMFATATLLGSHPETATAVPATAILQLHDRSYVFLPGSGDGNFRRVQVKLGQSLPGNMVEIQGTVSSGQQVVANALDLQNTADQE